MSDFATTEFESESFAEGRFRRAYKGIYTSPRKKAGQQCVVKILKDSHIWEPTDWNTAIKIQEEAQNLAEDFNKFTRKKHPPIKFTEVRTHRVTEQEKNATPKLNECVIVEDFIPGNFKKWLSNYGYISDEVSFAKSMPAFAHWSWWHTGGEKMIADLQGVRSDDGYTLTDPVLMSQSVNGQIYGCTDTGVEGIALFFLNHECNDICNSLPRPTFDSIGISRSQLHLVKKQLEEILKNATAYSHELMLPPEIRSRLVEPLKTTACRYNLRPRKCN